MTFELLAGNPPFEALGLQLQRGLPIVSIVTPFLFGFIIL